MRTFFVLSSLLGLGVVAVACGDDGAGGSGAEGGFKPIECDAHKTPGPSKFSDTTENWGLADVNGTRMSAGDLDHDGYPDLIVHSGVANTRQIDGMAERHVYVLMNEPDGKGGRTFIDRTEESGYAAVPDAPGERKSSQLAIFGDVDNDGDLDVYSGTFHAKGSVHTPRVPADDDTNEIYLNDGTGKLTLKADANVHPRTLLPTVGASFVDIDRNGSLDLFVGYHYVDGALKAPQLLSGHGDGAFSDISSGAGMNSVKRAAFGVTACDLDNDGNTELLLSAYARGPSVALVSDGKGGWTDVGQDSAFARDDNEDFTDNQNFLCYCTVHADYPGCSTAGNPLVQCPTPADGAWAASEEKPDRLGGNTFSTVCSDITGDGKLDVYHAEIAHWWAGQSSDKSNLLTNTTEGSTITFERADREARGLEWEHPTVDWNEGGLYAAAQDLDNDGREDLLVGASDYPDQSALYFHQKSDGNFEEIAQAQGLDHPCVAGMAVADFDRDGDLDVVFGSSRARDCADIWPTNEVHFYENDAASSTKSVAIRLAGRGNSNRGAIGARVTLDAGGTKITKELSAGNGHMAMHHDQVLFFGIGECEAANSVEVRWPDKDLTVETWTGLPSGKLVEITQGKTDYSVVDLASK